MKIKPLLKPKKQNIKIIKVTLFMMFVCTFQLIASTGKAENAIVTLPSNTVTVETLFAEIEKQSEYLVVFRNKELNPNATVTLKKKEAKVSEILDEVLEGTNLKYEYTDNNYIIFSKKSEGTAIVQQDTKKITGVIKDNNGEPIIGANVIVKGGSVGAITDLDGHFSLEVPANATLQISYIGYTSQEVSVGNRSNIEVVLKEDAEILEEVVVIGYGTAKKKDLTGAISRVRAEEMEAEAPRSVEDLLRASAAGLSLAMSSEISGAASMQIRGKNTLSAESTPLIVLDGVIYNGDIQDINPTDIESVDVLKDASSVAVYGAKAANGVVAITTKKGKEGKITINFNTNLGVVSAANLPPVVDGAGFLKMRQEYFEGLMTSTEMETQPGKYVDPRRLSALGVDALAWYNYDQKTPVGSLPDEESLIRTWLSRLNLTNVETDNYLKGVETNWDDVIYQSGLQQNYTASISNRTDKFSYYWSLGYTDREGVVVGDRYVTYRMRLNLESKITDFLTVGITSQFASRDQSFLKATTSARESLSPYTTNEIDNLESPYRLYPSGENIGKNPFIDNYYTDRKNVHEDLNANIYAIVKFPLGIEYQVNFTPRYHYNEYFDHKSSKHPEWAGTGGESERRHTKTYDWMLDNIIRWKYEFGKHRVEATFLFNAEKGQLWQTTAGTQLFSPSDVLGYHNILAGTVPTVSSNDTYQTADALMGRLFYSYKDKYLLTASVRRDGYSAFGQENPRATFPAIALGWVFTEEKFMKKASSWLDYGKLRLSWGINGNRAIGQYAALATMTSSLKPYINQSGSIYTVSELYASTMPNSSLKWEKTTAYNIGLDFTLFGNKLRGSMEFYNSETNDLLVDRRLPSIVGYQSVKANLGKLANYGLELSLNADVIKHKNFVWRTTGTFSLNRREIKQLYGDMEAVKDAAGNVIGYQEANDYDNEWFIGHDPDQIWDYENAGVWQLNEAEEAQIYGNTPGDMKYVDQNNDGVLNNDDKVFQGNRTPRFRWSWRNDFTFYKNFNLSFMLYSNVGHWDTFNRAANKIANLDRRTVVDIPRWTKDNPTNEYGRLGSVNIGNVYRKKTFIRMESISLSYAVPKTFLNKFAVQNMRLSLSVRNPFVISSWDFGDPEGGDLTLRSVNFGLNFTL